ncbi:MAG: carboxypeptidase-like regulatory domain-containing protein, partial [Acidobacteriota bacterium]
ASVAGSTLQILAAHPRLNGDVLAWFAGQEGRITIPALPDAADSTILIWHPDHAPFAFRGSPSSLPSAVRLQPGATVAGTITDSQGRGIASAVVGLSTFVSPRIPFSVLRPTATAADGSWRLSGLPLGEADLLIRAHGFGPEARLLEIREPSVDLGLIELQKATAVAFRVIDVDDQPIAGARLTLEPGLAATTNAQGRARIDHMPAKTSVDGRVEAAGFVPLQIRLTPPIEDPVRLRMVRAVRVTGRLVNADGVPVLDGRVRIETGSTSRTRPLAAAGGFELELPPDTPARLVFFSPATIELQTSIPASAPGEIRDLGDLKASPGLSVTGRLVSADAQPVTGARIWAPRGGAERALLSWVQADAIEGYSGADGAFRLTGLPARSATLRIEAPGLARHHLPLRPQPEQTTIDVGEVELESGSTVRIVTDAAQRDATARIDLGNAWLEPDMLTAPVFDGVAEIPHVPSGRFTASVVVGDRLLCDVGVEVPRHAVPVEVDCSEGAMRVQGTVVVGHQPSGPGWLSWRPPGERAHAAILRHGDRQGRHQSRVLWGGRPDERVEVDASGFFTSDRLRSGSWDVSWTGAEGHSASQQVDLPESPHYELVLRFAGGSLEGTVSEADGSPVPGARVRDHASGAWAISGDDGSFTLHAVGEGPFALQARLDTRSSELVRIENASSLNEAVALVLVDPEQIVIEVFDASEQPVAGALVFLEEATKRRRILTTAHDGRATAPLHPPRAQQVRAAAYIGGSWVLSEWQALEGPAPSLSLRQEEGGSIRIMTPHNEDEAEPIHLVSSDAWDISWLATRLGHRPTVMAGRPWTQHGLPPGSYEVRVGQAQQRVEVEPGQLEDVELEP